MQTKKNAIVFIPGLDSSEKNANLRRLVNGFLNVPENAKVEEAGESKVAGESGIQLRVTVNSEEKMYDFYEANWWDLTVLKDEENPLKKMKQGFSLLTYWFFSRIWRTIRKSPYMMLSVILSSFILILWYYGILVLAFSAIGNNPEIITSVNQSVSTGIARTIGNIGNSMGGWYVWAAASFLMGFLPVNSLVRISGFTKRYLQNQQTEDGIGLRDKIRNRVKDTINNILKDDSYEHVTILSHSFGTVVGVDILADLHLDPGRTIRFVTIGSPLYFLSHRSNWIETEIKKCLANESIASWLDFYSNEDWLCSKIPGHGENDKTTQKSIPIYHEASLFGKLKGDTHLAYFSSQPVIENLVA